MMASKAVIRITLAVLVLIAIFGAGSQWVAGALPSAGSYGASGWPLTTAELETLKISPPAVSSPDNGQASPGGPKATAGELAAMLAAETLLLDLVVNLVNLPFVVR